MDLDNLDACEKKISFLGCKGAIGTQASFLALFNGNHRKVERLDELVAQQMGFRGTFSVTGQTYSRKLDFDVMCVLSGIAQSAHKFANDFRLLQNLGEIEEPYESEQVGSSAMPHKRNPMRSERLTSLARFVICNAQNSAFTAANQWFERTLDDSANKRITFPEAFLAADAILMIYLNIVRGRTLNFARVRANVERELPFLATEKLLMEAAKKGADRQGTHETIRRAAVEAAKNVKNGRPNDLLERLGADQTLGKILRTSKDLLNPRNFVGRAPEQVEAFIKTDVKPRLKRVRRGKEQDSVLRV
jgi:adenylosuccinate lyase